MLNNVLLLRL